MREAGLAIRMKHPSHPGAFVLEIVLEPLGLNVTEAARVLKAALPTLSYFRNQCASLSPEMAIRLDKAFGADMKTPMRMQTSYHIAPAKQRAGEIAVER